MDVVVMRKNKREPAKLDGLELFRILDVGGDTPVHDPGRLEAVLDEVRSRVSAALDNPATVNGWRTQALFASLVVALDGCELLTTVDSGEVFVDGDDVKLPDYLLVLRDGRRLVVDVKSEASRTLDRPLRLSQSEMSGLRRYANLVDSELYIAVYFVALGQWALVPGEAYRLSQHGKYEISVENAFKTDAMSVLGDFLVGVVPPIQLDLVAAPGGHLSGRGEAQITIDGVVLRVGGHEMVEPHEKEAAWFLLVNGDWGGDQLADLDEKVVRGISFVTEPEEPIPDQEFQMVGRLSSMYTRWFISATSDETSVTALQAVVDPGALRSIIPQDFTSERLRMWRFILQPQDIADLLSAEPTPDL